MIELNEVAVRYTPSVVGLHPVSLRFHADQMTVLLGQSGAGKSTLLRTINLLTAPTSGDVVAERVGRLHTAAAIRAHRCRTAMIFQQHQLIGRLTALQNVMVGRVGMAPSWRTLFPSPRRDRLFALECLDRVGLADRALERTSNLSGGQQQRVGIARALAQEPRLILADEPVASLDPGTSHRVLTHLKDIVREDGIPAIVSLHQLDLARTFADRIIALADGRIVFDGAPDNLTAEHLSRIYGSADSAAAKPPTLTRAVSNPKRAATSAQSKTPELEVLD